MLLLLFVFSIILSSCVFFFFFFFFSSRRRHTRFDCDWSSDVCSSDLSFAGAVPPVGPTNASHGSPIASRALQDRVPGPVFTTARLSWFRPRLPTAAESLTWSGARERVATGGGGRSEERRVGKEWRSRWSPYH